MLRTPNAYRASQQLPFSATEEFARVPVIQADSKTVGRLLGQDDRKSECSEGKVYGNCTQNLYLSCTEKLGGVDMRLESTRYPFDAPISSGAQ